MVDVNHDSRPDLITLTPFAVAERLQRADGTFARFKNILKVKSGRSLAVGDVNGDHNPDIYVVCGRTRSDKAAGHLLLGNCHRGLLLPPAPPAPPGGRNRGRCSL